MSRNLPRVSSRRIQIAVLASASLVNISLKSLIEQTGRRLHVSSLAGSSAELLKKVEGSKPDVVLLCLTDDDSNNAEIIPQIISASPKTRVVVLTQPNGKQNPTDVLKKGAMGIVGLNQSASVLIRAIEQVFDGETWLSQKLVSQILDKNSGINRRDFESPRSSDLTNREMQVVRSISSGLSNKEISKTLRISEATVRHHLSSIYGKLNVTDRLNLVIHAYQNGIVKLPEFEH
ncbi:MAG: response regulator transcription factor [Pyrinomonadaceae bacterium]|nr:response regulator transcription factor [Pyrinomonadaceae bacterium]